MSAPPSHLARTGRITKEVAYVVVALLGGLVFLGVRLTPEEGVTPPADWLFAIDALLGLVALSLIPFRKRWPLTIALLAVVCTAMSSSAVLAAFICVASLATRRRIRDAYIVGPIIVAGAVIPVLNQPVAQILTTLVSAVITFAIFWLAGAYLGARRDLLASAQDRAATLEREQALRISQAQTAERTRIAQEMHDVLAHRISLIAVHANVLAFREDLSPEQTKEHATVVRDAAEKAVSELADVLGVLRGRDGVDNAQPPQPTLARLPELIDDARRAGTPVTVVGAIPDLDDLPDDTSRTAFRILQECLTNARKHATTLPVTITITGEPCSHLTITVQNPVGDAGAVIAGSGMGLVGLAERAELAGGHLEFGDRGGFFVVEARLKWRTT